MLPVKSGPRQWAERVAPIHGCYEDDQHWASRRRALSEISEVILPVRVGEALELDHFWYFLFWHNSIEDSSSRPA